MSRKGSKKYGAERVEFATLVGRPARMAGMKRQIKGLSRRLDEIPFPQ